MMSLLIYIRTWLHNLKTEEGQDLIEYALLLGLIALAAVVAIGLAGAEVNNIWNAIVTELQTALGAGG